MAFMEATQQSYGLKPGTKLDQYSVEQIVEQGPFGITYLATDGRGGRFWVRELLPSEFATRMGDEARALEPADRNAMRWWLRSFLDEAAILGRLNHPSLLPVVGAFEANGTGYCVHPVIAGEKLSTRLEREGTLSEPELRRMLGPILGALDLTHGANLLHRDIRPENILITPDGHAVLTNFGVLRAPIRLKSRTVFSVTSSVYAAPEEGSATGVFGPWTDLYAVAAILYRAATGAAPVDAALRVRGIMQAPVGEKSAIRASEALLTSIDWGLKLAHEERPQSVVEWRRVLQAEGELPEGVAMQQQSSAKAAKPRRLPIVAIGVVAVALAGVGYFVIAKSKSAVESSRAVAAEPALKAVAPVVVPAVAAGIEATTEPPASGRSVTSSLSQLEQAAMQQMVRDRQQALDAQRATLKAQIAAGGAKVPGDSSATAISKLAPVAAATGTVGADASKPIAPPTAAASSPGPAAVDADAEAIAARNKQLEQELALLKAEQAAQLRKRQDDQAARELAEREAAEKARNDEEHQKAVIAKSRAQCEIPAADLSVNGTLTYDTAMRVAEAVKLRNGAIRLPPVTLPNGRSAQFDITPDSCARRVAD